MDSSHVLYTTDQKPPFYLEILLGLQHSIAIASTLVVPLLIFASVKLNFQSEYALITGCIFAMGIGTLLMCMKQRFFGTGFLCPVLCEPAFLVISIGAVQVGGVGLLFGMIFLAGIFQVFFAAIYPAIRRFFPTELCGIVVIMVGLSLVKPDIIYSTGSPSLNFLHFSENELLTAIVTFASMTILLIWGKWFARCSLLIGVILGFIVASWQGLILPTDYAKVLQAPFFEYNIPFTLPSMKFDFSFTISFIIASIAIMLKGIGGVISCQKMNATTWKRPEQASIRKALFTNAIANIISSMCGGVALGTANNNVALAYATGVTSRRVGITAGIILLIFAFIPKIIMLLAIMPKAIIGATLLFVTSYIIVSGIQILGGCNLDNRKIFIVGLSIVSGMAVQVHQINLEHAPEIIRAIAKGPIIVATLVAIILNILFSIGYTQKASLEVNTATPSSGLIQTFMVKQGALWYAPNDLTQALIGVLLALTKDISALNTDVKINFRFSYTEFELILWAYYEGEMIGVETSHIAASPSNNMQTALNVAKSLFPEMKILTSQTVKNRDCKIKMKFVQ